MLTVGLTGGVASGKSVVSQILKKEGAHLIDADQIARELVQPGTPCWKELVRAFGKGILQKSGSIDRKKLAARIFADPEQRNLLNRIIHPRIKKEMGHRLKAIGRKDPEGIVVVDAPLLIETGDQREMDKVIVVTSTEAQQVERLREREGMDRGEAKGIIASQISTEEKLRFADFVIRNEGSLEDVERKTREVFQELKRIALRKEKRD
jgi:dephospho-CoA kinase